MELLLSLFMRYISSLLKPPMYPWRDVKLSPFKFIICITLMCGHKCRVRISDRYGIFDCHLNICCIILINAGFCNIYIYMYICSDRANWGIYFGYCCWVWDCILLTKRVVDSGPGSPSDLVLLSWEIAALRWWPLAVAGGVSQLGVYS